MSIIWVSLCIRLCEAMREYVMCLVCMVVVYVGVLLGIPIYSGFCPIFDGLEINSNIYLQVTNICCILIADGKTNTNKTR